MSIRKNNVGVSAIISLNDGELCKLVREGGSLRDAALDELYRRHGEYIQQKAIRAAHKFSYDKDLGEGEDLELDACSEGFTAAYGAFLRYDGVSCALRTYLVQNINSRFMDLQRNNAKHCTRESLLSSYEYEDENGESYSTDYLEKDVAAQRAYADEEQRYYEDATTRMLNKLTGKKRACFEALLTGSRKGVDNLVAFAADVLGCTTANVYATIKGIRKEFPGSLAANL